MTMSTLLLWLWMAPAAEPPNRRATIEAMNEAVEAYERGEFAEAEATLEQLAYFDHRYAPLRINLARLYLRQQRPELALGHLRGALGLVGPEQQGELFFQLGSALMSQDLSRDTISEQRAALREAAEAFASAAAADPLDYRAHHNRALALDRLDEPGLADSAYRRCLELQPGHVPCYLDLARMYVGYGFVDEALAVLERGTEQNPRSGSMWLGAAEVHLQLHRWDEAVATVQKALALDPDLTDAYFVRSVAALEQRKYDQALTWINEYLRRAPPIRPGDEFGRRHHAQRLLEQLHPE